MQYTCRRTEQKAAEYESIKEAIVGRLGIQRTAGQSRTERQWRSRGRHSQRGHQAGYQANQSSCYQTLDKLDVGEGSIVIENKGAFDCMIRARVQTAVLRGCDTEELEWEKLYETAW